MKMSVEELVTELSMTYSFNMHLVLEGDDDIKFFRSVLNRNNKVNFLCVYGADNVMSVVRKVDDIRAAKSFIPTLGIIDRDYQIPLGKLLKSPNLLCTDARDIECMMFNSLSFHAVLDEFGSATKIAALGGPPTIATAVKNTGKIIGMLRFYSQNEKKGTSFQKLEISRLVDKKTLTIDPEKLVEQLNAQQGVDGGLLPNGAITFAKKSCDDALCDKGLNYFQSDLLLTRGHDLMDLLAVGFRSLFGSRSAAESSRENVESMFRLSYVTHFKSSALAHSIENWLIANALSTNVSLA